MSDEHKQYHISEFKDVPFSLFTNAIINLVLMIMPEKFECYIRPMQSEFVTVIPFYSTAIKPDNSPDLLTPFAVIIELSTGDQVTVEFHTPKYTIEDTTAINKVVKKYDKTLDASQIARDILTHITTVKPVFTRIK